MEIYLLRHGIAEDARNGMRDADRALTPEGSKKLRAVLQKAAAASVSPSLILASPLRRARQTAEIAANVFGYREEILTSGALEPGSSPESVWEELRLHKDEPQVLLAGHEPLFSALMAYLLEAPTLRVDFKKGALARIDGEAANASPRGVLRWMITSKLA